MTLTHSQARRPSDLQRQLLGLVASSAESIGSFSRAQLTETEGLTSITPLESRRLRRMWDDRLAWRLRQRPTADAAEACGPSTTSASVRSHMPSTTMRSHQELWQSRLNDPRWAKQELWRAEAVAARGPLLAKSVAMAPVVSPSSQTASDHAVNWAPTVAAIAGATVMQVAEMAAVAMMSEAAKHKRLAPSQAVVTGSANEHVGAHESLEEATSVTAAAVMQAAEMTAVALIKVANKWI